MASKRRMGQPDSEMREAMLDAAEVILRERGYAALTSRSVADQTGVKQRLVYYYFQTMDEVIEETFRRLAVRELERLKLAASHDRPLHEIWDVCINTSDARLVSEFMALAYRSEGIREQVVKYIDDSRKLQMTALKQALAKSSKETLPPAVIAIVATSLALAVNREAALGLKTGHTAVNKVIADFLKAVEP